MADGTKIWVNSGTKLIYPAQFRKKERDIFVDGEIYLEVNPEESIPFIVHSKELDIKVLGTSFNVTAYKEDGFSNVVLISGSVDIITGNKQTTRLTPNNCFHMEDGIKSIKPVNVYNYICWKDGIMKLDEAPLNEIFIRLSRYYNVTILFDSDYSRIQYNGKLSLDGSIENVLHNISLTEPIIYTRKENTIIIK